MDMRLKTFAFAFATLLVVPLHGMSPDDNGINNGGEKTPEPTAGIKAPFSSPQVLSMGTASAQVSFVKQSAQAGSTAFSNTDKQFVKQAAQDMQQEPDSLSDSHGSSPEFDGDVQTSYSSSQASHSHGALSTHLSASASHLASHSGNSFSPPVSPIPLTLTETDVQPVVTVIEQSETKTEQHDIVPLAPTYGTSDDAISQLLQENYQRIATYNPRHAWLLAQVTDFRVEGRSVIQVYLDARYDEQKDAIIQTIESMNPGLNQRYPETTENPAVDHEGKDAIDDTTSGGTTTSSTGSLATTQPAAAIATQSCGMQGSGAASDWASQVFVAPAVVPGTNTVHVTTSTGVVSTTHSTTSIDTSDDDNDESGVSRTCVITSRPGADTH